MKNSHKSKRFRRGFTLLELLIVVAVIASLAGLSVVVLLNITDNANEAATITTISKINRLVEQRLEGFDRSYPANADEWNTIFRSFLAQEIADRNGAPVERVNNLLAAFTSDLPAWDVLARKAAFRQEFPQRFFDLDLLDDSERDSLPQDFLKFPVLVRNRYLAATATQQLEEENGGTAPSSSDIENRMSLFWNNHDPVTESAEMLYFMIFHSGTYGSGAEGEDTFRGSEVADTDNDGLPEFVDAWGNPLRFYRWPTRLIDPSARPEHFVNVIFGGQLDPNGPDPSDLAMVVSNGGIREDVPGEGVPGEDVPGRVIDEDERAIADLLIKGLPRRLSFSTEYERELAEQRPSGVSVIVPPDELLRDPDDPAGLIYTLLENGLQVGNDTIDVSFEFNELQYHTPDTFHAPLIVSAGLDEVLGLHEPNDEGNLGNLAAYDLGAGLPATIDALSDNITNRNRRSGGQR